MDNFDWNTQNRRIVVEGTVALGRTAESLARSNRIALETEQVGTNIIGDLNEQRETLLRSKGRLVKADDELNETRSLLKKMGRQIVYNKIVLILIIIFESVILGFLVRWKFFVHK